VMARNPFVMPNVLFFPSRPDNHTGNNSGTLYLQFYISNLTNRFRCLISRIRSSEFLVRLRCSKNIEFFLEETRELRSAIVSTRYTKKVDVHFVYLWSHPLSRAGLTI